MNICMVSGRGLEVQSISVVSSISNTLFHKVSM